jgi:hypothetical protein
MSPALLGYLHGSERHGGRLTIVLRVDPASADCDCSFPTAILTFEFTAQILLSPSVESTHGDILH